MTQFSKNKQVNLFIKLRYSYKKGAEVKSFSIILDIVQINLKMAASHVMIIIFILQCTVGGLNFEQRSRVMELDGSGDDEVGSGVDEVEVDFQLEDNDGSVLQSLLSYVLPIKAQKFLFAKDAPFQYLINYDYGKLIESVQIIVDFIADEESPGHYIANYDYGHLVSRLLPIFSDAVPRSLNVDQSKMPVKMDIFLKKIYESFTKSEIFQFAGDTFSLLKLKARSLTSEVTTTSILLYSAGVFMLGGFLAISIPITAILGTIFYGFFAVLLKTGKTLVDR